MRSADNVLPLYIDAVAPLLVMSPRLVSGIGAWTSRLLSWSDMCWPTTRLMLLAARGDSEQRSSLPPHSLGRLPPELVRGRILAFLAPPALSASAASQDVEAPAVLCDCWRGEDRQKDVVAVLAHLIVFVPAAAWAQLSCYAFALAEDALTSEEEVGREDRIYLAASVVVSVAQRLERSAEGLSTTRAIVIRLAGQLHVAADLWQRTTENPSGFVVSRVKAAAEQCDLLQESS